MINRFGFSSFDRRFEILIEAKEDDGNILTLDAYEEMIDLHEFIYNDVWIIRSALNLGGGLSTSGNDPGTYKTICKLNTLWDAEEEDLNGKDAKVDFNVSINPATHQLVYHFQ